MPKVVTLTLDEKVSSVVGGTCTGDPIAAQLEEWRIAHADEADPPWWPGPVADVGEQIRQQIQDLPSAPGPDTATGPSPVPLGPDDYRDPPGWPDGPYRAHPPVRALPRRDHTVLLVCLNAVGVLISCGLIALWSVPAALLLTTLNAFCAAWQLSERRYAGLRAELARFRDRDPALPRIPLAEADFEALRELRLQHEMLVMQTQKMQKAILALKADSAEPYARLAHIMSKVTK